jgi:hypothetical protein
VKDEKDIAIPRASIQRKICGIRALLKQRREIGRENRGGGQST